MEREKQISPDERVVAAWADSSGFRHVPMIMAAVAKRGTTEMRLVYLHDHEVTDEIRALMRVAAVMHEQMTHAVYMVLTGRTHDTWGE